MKQLLIKITGGLLAAVMAVGLTTSAFAAAPALPENWENPFSDVPQDAWYTPFVATLHQGGVVSGYDDGRFGPKDPAYAGQAILMLLKAAGIPAMEPGEGEHYAAPYVQKALSYKWLTAEEIPEDLNTPVDRLYVGRLAARALDLEPSEAPSPFADLDDPLVTALYEAGVIAGVQEGDVLNFNPQGTLTRAEISTIVWNVMEYMKNYIRYRDHVLEILPDVPAFSYDREKFLLEGQKMTYTGGEITPMWGIDVSRHQGEVDWQKVADQGVEFVMLRGGYRGYGTGVLREDENFRTNIKGALDAGLEVGVYVFSQAVTVGEAEEEARLLLDLVRDYPVTCPLVFDWERISDDEARTDHVETQMLTDMVNAFTGMIEEAGYEPMIYLYPHAAYLYHDLSAIAGTPFWLADYNEKPTFYYDFEMWQYTSDGSLEGIEGRVDLNLWLRPLKK